MTIFDFAEVQEEVKALSGTAGAKKKQDELAALSEKRGELDYFYREARLALEKKFHEMCTPLYEQRSLLVSANDEELESFWMRVLKNHPLISNLITEADEPLLSALVDVKLSYTGAESCGFKIDFVFGQNDFIDNKTLSKTYILENVKDSNYQDLVFDRTEATPIEWKAGKNLCFKEVTKTQRHKASGAMRTVTKEVATESFFHFFDPMSGPSEDDDMDEEQLAALEEEIQIDIEIGNVFKTSIIPRAYDWFTGKALSMEEYDSDDEEGNFAYGQEESDEDLGSELESDGGDADDTNNTEHQRENPQCKQQ